MAAGLEAAFSEGSGYEASCDLPHGPDEVDNDGEGDTGEIRRLLTAGLILGLLTGLCVGIAAVLLLVFGQSITHVSVLAAILLLLKAASYWLQRYDLLATDNGFFTGAGYTDVHARLPALYLSAGQRRRLSLARLRATARPIWLLDEPGSALDSAGQAMLGAIMRTHLAGGGLILAAIHGPIALEQAQELRLGGTP